MPSAQRTITIDRPLAEVFAFFADAENDPQWRKGVTEMKRDGPLVTGARYRQRIAGPGGRAITADIELTDYRPEESVAFRGIAGPVRPVGGYRFTPIGGSTEVTFSLSAELTGLKKLLMGKPVQKSMDGEMAALDNAKRVLESR